MPDALEKARMTENIILELKKIFDPEIPVNIYDLGLIYDIRIRDDEQAYVLMTLTSPNCPVAESLPVDVKNAVERLDGISKCEVEITFDPPWDKDMISDAALLELGLL